MPADCSTHISRQPDPSLSAEAPVAETRTTCDIGEIPAWIDSELEQLYEQIHSFLPRWRIFRPGARLSSYVSHENGIPVTILIFEIHHRKVEVCNQMIRLTEEEIQHFADLIFAKFRSIGAIRFEAIRTDLRYLSFPYRRCTIRENFVIDLPSTAQAYTESLGKGMRYNLRRYHRKLSQDFPSLQVKHYAAGEIDARDIEEIVRLGRRRIAGKKRDFVIDEARTGKLIELARQHGWVTVILVGDKICAGTLSYRIGNAWFGELIGQDNAYDAYSIGTLCDYFSLCEIITRGGRRFEFGAGRFDYKKRFLARQHDMERIEIYRNTAQLLLHGNSLIRTTIDSNVRKLRIWAMENDRHPLIRMARSAMQGYRRGVRRLTLS